MIRAIGMPGSPEEKVLDCQPESLVDHGAFKLGKSGAPPAAEDFYSVGRMIAHEVESLKEIWESYNLFSIHWYIKGFRGVVVITSA